MNVRIGFFNSSLPQPERKPGGVDVYVDRLASHLVRRGHEVRLFSYSPKPASRHYDHVQLEPARHAHSRIHRMSVIPVRLNMLDTSGLDVMHLHGDDWFYLRRGLPTVRTFYGSARDEARTSTRLRRRARQHVTFALEILASRLATASYGLIPGDGAAYRTAGFLAPAVDLPAEIELRRPGPPTVLFVGAWNGRKQGWMLHDIFVREVLPHVPDAELVMVSDRCEPGPNVRWVQRPTDDELRSLYRRAWVFCLPSSYEGFGVPYLESMAEGTPVVATPNPGARYVLDNGRYGTIATESKIGAALVALLTDPKLRSEQATAGRKRVAETFTWTQTVDAHELAYEAAIAAWNER